jgi:hypothetical protein
LRHLFAFGCLGLILITAACTRARPTVVPPTALPAEAAQSAQLSLDSPQPGSRLGAPIILAGQALLEPGQMLVGQVSSRDGGQLRWRGNARIEPDSTGRFEGEVGYTLAEAAAGQVELMVIDAASGTVIDRRAIEVQLDAAP